MILTPSALAPPQAPTLARRTPYNTPPPTCLKRRSPGRPTGRTAAGEPPSSVPLCPCRWPRASTLTPRAAASRGQGTRIAPAARAPPPAGSGGPGAGPGPAYAGRAGDALGLQAPRSLGALSEAGGAGERWGRRLQVLYRAAPPAPPPPAPAPAPATAAAAAAAA